MKLIIADMALTDLRDVWGYIARDDIDAADKFVDEVYQRCERLVQFPETGRRRDELLPGLRSLPIGRYIVFYRLRGEAVEIARVLSAYRDLDAIF